MRAGCCLLARHRRRVANCYIVHIVPGELYSNAGMMARRANLIKMGRRQIGGNLGLGVAKIKNLFVRADKVNFLCVVI